MPVFAKQIPALSSVDHTRHRQVLQRHRLRLLSGLKSHFLQNITIPRNGYVYIYCSNESNIDVWYDNLELIHTRGQILEETHYYPFGLTMAGISSKAAGGMDNKYKFNSGTELNNDFGISFYETDNRLYDPQIGRFWQVDELAEANWEWTPYNFGLNNPISFNDPSGLIESKEKSTPENPKDIEEVRVRAYSHNQMQSLYWTLRNRGIDLNSIVNDNLRERVKRWDGIQRYMEVVHTGVKEDGLMLLEAASWFIPTAWLLKVKYLKYAVNLFKVRRAATPITKGGVYVIETSAGKYIGQSKDFIKRLTQHFSKGGKLSGQELENVVLHEMPNATKLEREVFEQFLIDKHGIDNLLNIKKPMGGRRELFDKLKDVVMKKFNLF